MLKPSNIILIILSAFIALYHSTAWLIMQSWLGNSAYSHGLILWPFSTYIAFQQWNTNSKYIHFNYSFIGVLSLLALSLLWFVSGLVYVEIVQQISFILLIILIIFSLFGARVAQLFIFPIAILFSTIPLWDHLNSYLQLAAANGSGWLLEILSGVLGFSVLQEGNLLTVPAGTFEVARSCSGLRYIIVGVTLPLIHSYILRFSPTVMIFYALVGGLLAYIANTIRVAIIVIAGEVTDMKSSLVEDHLWLGWVIFAVAIFALIMLVEKYLHSFSRVENRAHLKKYVELSNDIKPSMPHWAYLLPIVLALSVGPILAHLYQPKDNLGDPVSMVKLSGNDTWKIGERPDSKWQPQFQRLGSLVASGSYQTEDGGAVDLFLSHYAWQEPEREAVSVINRVYEAARWSEINRKMIDEVQIGATTIDLEETLIRRGSGGEERIVWRWYLVGQHRTANKYLTKALNVWNTLKGDPSITVFVVSTDVDGGYGDAVERMRQLVSSKMGTWEAFLKNYSKRTFSTE